MFKATLQALAITAALAAAPAQALTLTTVACSGHGTTMTSQPGYLGCAGAFSGNNSNQDAGVQAEILTDFGLSVLAETDVTGTNGTHTTGSFTFADMASPFVLALKAGDAFSLYLFAAHTHSINFDTLGVGFISGGKHPTVHFGQGLSHATLYSSVNAVPEPETYALLAAGLAFVGWASRRRQRKQ